VRETQTPQTVSGDFGEVPGLADDFDVVRRGVVGVVRLRSGAVDPDELVAIRERERLEQQKIRQAEHRRVQADAEREGDECDRGEPRRSDELPEGVAKIVHGGGRSSE
jgi:hypothetical protein